MEDTCILIPGADYAEVCAAVGSCRTGVFGYGNRCLVKGATAWHGTKAVYMTREWCDDMSIILDNTHAHPFKRAHMWLTDLMLLGKAFTHDAIEACVQPLERADSGRVDAMIDARPHKRGLSPRGTGDVERRGEVADARS